MFEVGDMVMTVESPESGIGPQHQGKIGEVVHVKDDNDPSPYKYSVRLQDDGWSKRISAREDELLRYVELDDAVTSPGHYQSGLGIEVIDIINEYFHDNYNLGNVIKYLLRADKKGNRQQDLEKALQYLTWEVERGRG